MPHSSIVHFIPPFYQPINPEVVRDFQLVKFQTTIRNIPIFTGRRNIFVVHFFPGGSRQSDSILWTPFDQLARSVLPLWARFKHFSTAIENSPPTFHAFFPSSFIFPLSRFEVWKEKRRRGGKKKKRRWRKKKKTVSFELERILLLLLLLLLQFSFFLLFFFFSLRVKDRRILARRSGLYERAFFDRSARTRWNFISFTNVRLKYTRLVNACNPSRRMKMLR